jgi:polygalacturonase
MRHRPWTSPALLVALAWMGGCAWADHPSAGVAGVFDVRRFGATGDGATLDTDAVNAAIAAAHAAGGGTVVFPAGRYACHSVHLLSNVALQLDPGATLAAAPPAPAGSGGPAYDPPEANPFDAYEDFGHSHFHNSLIWGDGIENVSVTGPGTIDGSGGLARGSDGDADASMIGAGVGPAPVPRSTRPRPARPDPYPNVHDTLPAGVGNKAIALRLCRNVTLRGFTIRGGGHFAILATGVDNLTVDDLRIDTNRDGMDIDSCRNVRVSNCTVNSPWDDGICLKSDFALGYARPCEAVTITNCQVSAWVCGSLLDGTRLPFGEDGDGFGGGTGRIKFGTESNGGFINCTVSNCVFDHCRGLALETVDGGRLEDVAIDNITMRRPVNSPIFLRLGSRLRGPEEVTTVGTLERVNISNVVVYDADPRYASIIAGLADHLVRDVKISNVQIHTRGGAGPTTTWATTQPEERESAYPEPSMFGPTPASGFYVRHAEGVSFDNVDLHVRGNDARSPFVLDDVVGATFTAVTAEPPAGAAVVAARTPTTRMAVYDSPDVRVPATTQP